MNTCQIQQTTKTLKFVPAALRYIIKLDKTEYYFNSLEITAFAVLLPSAS